MVTFDQQYNATIIMKSFRFAVIIVFLLAVIWEVLEYFVECHKSVEHIKRVYGSVEHWAYDCAGDIILAVLFGGIVVI